MARSLSNRRNHSLDTCRQTHVLMSESDAGMRHKNDGCCALPSRHSRWHWLSQGCTHRVAPEGERLTAEGQAGEPRPLLQAPVSPRDQLQCAGTGDMQESWQRSTPHDSGCVSCDHRRARSSPKRCQRGLRRRRCTAAEGCLPHTRGCSARTPRLRLRTLRWVNAML